MAKYAKYESMFASFSGALSRGVVTAGRCGTADHLAARDIVKNAEGDFQDMAL